MWSRVVQAGDGRYLGPPGLVTAVLLVTAMPRGIGMSTLAGGEGGWGQELLPQSLSQHHAWQEPHFSFFFFFLSEQRLRGRILT